MAATAPPLPPRGGRGVRPPQEILQRAAVSTRDVQPARPAFERKLQLIERDKGAPVAPRQKLEARQTLLMMSTVRKSILSELTRSPTI